MRLPYRNDVLFMTPLRGILTKMSWTRSCHFFRKSSLGYSQGCQKLFTLAKNLSNDLTGSLPLPPSFIFRSIRLAFLVTVILFQICQLRAANYQAEMSLKMERNKALFGHSFLNISGLTMPDKCLEHCLKNCLCMSFQICDDTIECQLCSANKYLKPLEMKPSQGCTNYDFGNREETEVNLKPK